MQNSRTLIGAKLTQCIFDFHFFLLSQLVRWWIVWRRRIDSILNANCILCWLWIELCIRWFARSQQWSSLYIRFVSFSTRHYACWQIWKSKTSNDLPQLQSQSQAQVKFGRHCIALHRLMWMLNYVCAHNAMQWENAVSIVHASRNTHAVTEFQNSNSNSNLYSALI